MNQTTLQVNGSYSLADDHIIAQKLHLNGKIKSLTEESAYYWKGEPKIFEPIKNSAISKKPKIAELFSGLGGTSLGFEMAGFETVLGVDIHAPSAETFRKSHPRAHTVLGDIRKIVSLDKKNSNNVISKIVKNRVEKNDLDVLIAGIPCQGFSLANKKRHHLDTRNYNFLYFMRMAEALKPKTVVIENVSGLASMKNGKFVDDIVTELENIGYKTEYGMLNAHDFGVPEKRRRLVFVGSLTDRIKLPQPTTEKRLTVHDAISDLPSLSNGESSDLYKSKPITDYQRFMREKSMGLLNHRAPKHPQSVIDKISRTKQGAPMYDRYKQRIRLAWNQPSPTQVSGGIRPQFQFGHPEDNRGLTIRERCRIQSIPDHVEVFGGIVQGRVQTGNAVPPLLAKAIARQIYPHLNT